MSKPGASLGLRTIPGPDIGIPRMGTGLLAGLWCATALLIGACSTQMERPPAPSKAEIQQDADRAFQQLQAEEGRRASERGAPATGFGRSGP